MKLPRRSAPKSAITCPAPVWPHGLFANEVPITTGPRASEGRIRASMPSTLAPRLTRRADLQPLLLFAGYDADTGIALQHVGSIDQLAVHLAGQCSLGKTGADIGGQFMDRKGFGIRTLGTVRQGNNRHVFLQW